jgi:ferredoxin
METVGPRAGREEGHAMKTTTRKIVEIDEDKCDGCGLCVPSCAEGAIRIVDGKARLMAENLCDGLGNCLGACPRGAITIEERPAEAFDEQAVEARKAASAAGESAAGCEDEASAAGAPASLPCGCPGTMARKLSDAPASETARQPWRPAPGASRLGHWPVQLALVPERGEMWNGADVLLAADCVAYAMGDFHERLLAGRALAVACPKLDDAEAYVTKLARIFAGNQIRSVTVARMEVPCCGGLERIARRALEQADKALPVNVAVIGVDGRTIEVNGLKVG